MDDQEALFHTNNSVFVSSRYWKRSVREVQDYNIKCGQSFHASQTTEKLRLYAYNAIVAIWHKTTISVGVLKRFTCTKGWGKMCAQDRREYIVLELININDTEFIWVGT